MAFGSPACSSIDMADGQHCAREDNFVARLGGDEFVIVCPEMDSSMDAEFLMGRIISSLRAPIEIGKNCHTIGVSIGIAGYPDQGQSMQELMEAADRAMYVMKAKARNRGS